MVPPGACEPGVSGAQISLSGVRMGGRALLATPSPQGHMGTALALDPPSLSLAKTPNEGLPSRVPWRGLLDRGTRGARKEGSRESPHPL